MGETPEEAGKRLRMQTASLEDDVDHDWRQIEDKVESLEEMAALLDPGLLQDAVGLVVVQIYLNRMRRSWEDLEDDDPRVGGDPGESGSEECEM